MCEFTPPVQAFIFTFSVSHCPCLCSSFTMVTTHLISAEKEKRPAYGFNIHLGYKSLGWAKHQNMAGLCALTEAVPVLGLWSPREEQGSVADHAPCGQHAAGKYHCLPGQPRDLLLGVSNVKIYLG